MPHHTQSHTQLPFPDRKLKGTKKECDPEPLFWFPKERQGRVK